MLATFAMTVRLEGVHPLQSGVLRAKRRSERRPGLLRENFFIFWSRYVGETIGKHAIFAAAVIRLTVMALLILRDGTSEKYMDQALTPVGSDGDEALDLFTQTTGGGAHIAHVKRVAAAIERGRPAA